MTNLKEIFFQSTAEEYRNKGLDIDVLQNEWLRCCRCKEFWFAFRRIRPEWLDSDDLLLENKLELSINLIQSGNFDLDPGTTCFERT